MVPTERRQDLHPDSAEYVRSAIPGLVQVRLFARGAQALVFRALDVEGRWLAIKLPSKEQARQEDLASRLRLESDLLRRLTHHRIVRVVRDGVLPDQRPYMITQWLEGRTLDQERLSIKRDALLCVLEDVIDAIAHAHQRRVSRRRGVVHRDLRPGNIMVTPGRRGMVLDFGTAKPLGYLSVSHFTQAGQWFGQSGFLAPEVLERGASMAGLAADVYSLGAILESFRVQLEDHGAPGQFQVLVDHCRATMVRDRYRDAVEVQTAFRSWRAHQAVPMPAKRVGREGRIRSMRTAALVLAPFLLFGSGTTGPGTMEWNVYQQEHLVQFLEPADAVPVQVSLQALHDLLQRAKEVPTTARSEAVSRAISAVGQLPGDLNHESSTVPARPILEAQLAMARIDALFHYTEPTPIEQLIPEVDRRQGATRGYSQGFWLGAEADSRLRSLCRTRDEAVERVIRHANASEPLVLAFRLFVLLQDARLPNGTGSGFGATRASVAELGRLLSRLESFQNAGVPPEWLALARARLAQERLWEIFRSQRRTEAKPYFEDVEAWKKAAREALKEIEEGSLLEAEMLRAELALWERN